MPPLEAQNMFSDFQTSNNKAFAEPTSRINTPIKIGKFTIIPFYNTTTNIVSKFFIF